MPGEETQSEWLTRQQKLVVWMAGLGIAATRVLAMARTLWDWDEALFCLSLRDYDVTLHHPHPPGFPVYIALGKIAQLFTANGFHALQAVNLVAAMLLFPAMFLLARELRLRFVTAISAAALLAFFPDVWFFGGGAFSDIPSLVLVMFAVAFLLRGRSSRNAYWIGTLLLALSIGIRPQNLLVGLIPGLQATRRRKPAEIAVAFFIGLATVCAAFGAAIRATGTLEGYLAVVRQHGEYIRRVDSFLSPDRTPLWRLFDRFFVKQYGWPAMGVAFSVFVVTSIAAAVRLRDRRMLQNAAIWTPFAIFAWLMLDRFSISRFSIGYAPMFAIFGADGIERVAVYLARGRQRFELRAQLAMAALICAAFAVYTLPALETAREESSPPIEAVIAARQQLDPAHDKLFVAVAMVPFVEYAAPGEPFVRVMDERALPLTPAGRGWLLAEIQDPRHHGVVFSRERGHLWNIARRHYFEVVFEPLRRNAEFGPGWYGPEEAGGTQWRWMSGRGVITLPPARGKTKLRLLANVPEESLARSPHLSILLNGRLLERLTVDQSEVQRDYDVVPAAPAAGNVLELQIDQTTRATRGKSVDPRELGLSLRYLGWGPA